MTSAFVGLGSNLQQPLRQVQSALQALKRISHSQLQTNSRLYHSRPMGPQDQPDYINAVACLDTQLSARELLHALQDIEQDHGRVRDGTRWGPRTLDLDLLVYGDEIINEPDLQVPHSGLHQRNFVLYPLHEIAPNLVIPGRGPLAALLAQCPLNGLEPVDAV